MLAARHLSSACLFFFRFVFRFSQIPELTRYAELVCDDLLVQTLPMHLFVSLCDYF